MVSNPVRIYSSSTNYTEMKTVMKFIFASLTCIVHKIRLLDPGKDTNLIFALYYRIGDNNIRLKMINKQKAEIEDRDRLIVDRNDGTSFADFECEY